VQMILARRASGTATGVENAIDLATPVAPAAGSVLRGFNESYVWFFDL
jgi:hypothetical protein